MPPWEKDLRYRGRRILRYWRSVSRSLGDEVTRMVAMFPLALPREKLVWASRVRRRTGRARGGRVGISGQSRARTSSPLCRSLSQHIGARSSEPPPWVHHNSASLPSSSKLVSHLPIAPALQRNSCRRLLLPSELVSPYMYLRGSGRFATSRVNGLRKGSAPTSRF